MTLLEMATFVCQKLTRLDPNSLALCKTFINARYKMIGDAHPWVDMQVTSEVGLDENLNQIQLPDDMDRVISIRSNGDTYLDPVNPNLLMQTDPTIFERIGLPSVYFEEFERELHQVTVYPTPNTPVSLLICAKLKLLDLVLDEDHSVIRNIDNALIAYATGDMLERQNTFEKAKLKFDEANAMLEAAKALETNQSNQPRQSKQLTVAGNSLAELVDAVCARTGQWGLDYVVLTKEFLRRQYQRIWDACNWSEATVCARVNNDGSEVILPPYFDRVIAVRAGTIFGQLAVTEPGLYFGISPSIFEQSGTPLSFSYIAPVGVALLPPTREKLSFFSSYGPDKSVVFISGELRGSMVSESITLNGNVPVMTANEYDVPLTIAKNITRGDVTVMGDTTGTQLVTILAGERERKHMRLWIQPTPSAAVVCLVLGKRTIKPLVQAEDTPMLRDIQDILISAACGDIFAKMGNTGAAEMARDAANTALKTLVDLEVQQGAFASRVVPDIYSQGDPSRSDSDVFMGLTDEFGGVVVPG